MTAADLSEVLAIERESFRLPWSRERFENLLRQNRLFHSLVAREKGGGAHAPVVGYLVLLDTAAYCHILNLAVRSDRRRLGVGRRLIRSALDLARRSGRPSIRLEVRQGNAPAVDFYRSLAFHETGLAQGYYDDGGENALLMERRVTG